MMHFPQTNSFCAAIGCLKVECFSDPTFNTNMIHNLVMDDRRRTMIRAMADNYTKQRNQGQDANDRRYKPWNADFIDSKGEGRILLLHGTPGVGKTYTAGNSVQGVLASST